jgi:hypothetical protein
MKVPVGGVLYRVNLVSHNLYVDGQRCFGLCDVHRQRIWIDRRCPVERRLSVFWHELAHAWKFELDVSGAPALETEGICNLIGRAMAAMDPELIARLHVYITRNIQADLCIVCPETRRFVPVRMMA